MPARDEIQFSVFPRGWIRDQIVLGSFRNSLRNLTNPSTGALFTEDEIARATQPGSRYWIEADAIDLWGQANQARARWMANQAIPHRATTAMLENVHAPMWLGADPRLPATGGSGTVSAPAADGSIFPGSTTLGDPTAAICTDPNGARYQNLEDVTASGGVAELSLRAIDTGVSTNIPPGTRLTWSQNAPLGAEPNFTIDEAFSGGSEIESDAELADRVESIMRYRPGAGNSAHFMAWCRETHVALEYAFVYPTFAHAGSVMVAITQKRKDAGAVAVIDGKSYAGPNARLDVSDGLFNAVVQYITPPYSPMVPEDWYVVVSTPTGQPSNIVLQLTMSVSTNGGWYDRAPWPHPADTSSPKETIITSAPSQTEFEVTVDTDDYLPGMTGDGSLTGEDVPAIMVWDDSTSRFEKLEVLSVEKDGTTVSVTLLKEPDYITLTVGMRISPYTELHETIARAAEAYFDELGPGELFDVTTDSRGSRARRYPFRTEKYPSHAGQLIVTRIIDALGSVSPDGQLVSISKTDPDYPDDVIHGPRMLTLGHLSIYPL